MRMLSPLDVGSADAIVLRHWIDAPDGPPARSLRARIVLLCGAGWGPSAIARELDCSKQTVITWRERYRVSGVAGLADGLRSGRPPKVDAGVVIRRTLDSPGVGTRWSSRSLGADLGLSNVAVANVWRRWGVKPLSGGRVLLTTVPVIDVPVTALVGIYVDPPLCLLAISTGSPSTGPGSAADASDTIRWPSALAEDDASGPPDGVRAAEFARRIACRGPRSTGASAARTRLVATDEAAALLMRAIPEETLTVHAVEGVASWRRVAGICCLMAGAHTSGAASVASAREAWSEHEPGLPFGWTDDAAGPPSGS